MAYLCPEGISDEALEIKNSEKLNEAISLLKSYSMINEGAEKNILNIHRLVQKVTRINLEEDEQQLLKITRKVKELTEYYHYSKEIELHYLHFLLHVSHNVELTKKLKLLTTRERILYIPFYSDHSVSSLVYLLDTAHTINTKEEYLKLLGEALSIYINVPSLLLLEETVKYVKSREQERVISQEDILIVLRHAHEKFNKIRRRAGFKASTNESNEYQKALKLFFEFKGEYIQEPVSCLSQEQRRKRSPESCLFSWEDVDEFNEEKEEPRNPNKIRINSDKFIEKIRELPEEKQDQLIQLAGQTGSTEESVNELVKHQKIKSHLKKVSKVSHALNTGFIMENIGSDILRGDFKDVGINLGLIGGGTILGEASQKVLAKGVTLESDKQILGRSLKIASPFVARGTAGFFAYNLINQIREYKAGNKRVLPDIISSGVFVGVDVAEAGIEAAELLEVIAGVSEFTGPIGEAVGVLIFLGMGIYNAEKQVEKIEKHVDLTEKQELLEGLRAFFGFGSSEEVKERNNQLVKNMIEFLKSNPSISKHIIPSLYKESMLQSTLNCTSAWDPTLHKIRSTGCRVPAQFTPLCKKEQYKVK